ncbi:hypothetical protein M9Y10_001066 [Tritrichomonas musculus]|uniref:RRM domain-containing protein n=1 Tax=Tritrichomonas musculus TaxID=1915356 RepID=A0ABR2L621_9EUKA
MCAAPSNFNSNLSMIQPNVPPQQAQALQQFGSYPVPYPLYPGLPYPSIPPGYPAIPIPIPLQQFPQNNNSKNSNDNDSDDRRNSGKRSHDSKSKHGSHRRSRDDYRDRKRGRDRDRHQESINKSPIHTVFFCNIPFEVNYNEFRDFATKFGEISNIYPIFDKGIAFVTYNDIRDAQKAVLSKDTYLLDRRVKSDFASKPPDHARKNPCDTCSTVLVKSLEDVSKIKAEDVIGKMREFGEIRDTSQDRPHSGEFIVKFYKLSDAKDCVAHNGLDLRHETLKIEYLPEEDAGEDPESTKGRRGDYKRRRETDYDNSSDDNDDSADENDTKKQQQLQQQQLIQMQMFQQMQQMQQMQQQLQQFQQLQGQYAPQPIPPPPPLQSTTTPSSTSTTQSSQSSSFPYGF